MSLTPATLASLRTRASAGTPIYSALAMEVGGCEVSSGIWRIFSETYPGDGVWWWNTKSAWRLQWNDLLPVDLFAFGEDVFGNQIVGTKGGAASSLWNHENGELCDLCVDPITLLETVARDGVDWIDAYTAEMTAVARRFVPLSRGSHLHWTRPLILGGNIDAGNITIVAREPHLVGHARLWRQIHDLPPGTEIRMS